MRFVLSSFHPVPKLEFSSTITLRKLESSEPKEPSSVHLRPLCPFQTLSGLCMNNTVSIYTGFLKDAWCWPSWTGFSDQLPLFSWGDDEQVVSFLTINLDSLARLQTAEEREVYNFIILPFLSFFFPSSSPTPPPILSKLAGELRVFHFKGPVAYFTGVRLRSRLLKTVFLFNLFSWDSFQSNI